MQCVANEVAFSQYYPVCFRYAHVDYSEYEPVEIQELENVEERADFMTKKSPRKLQKVSFFEQRNKRRKNEESDERKGGVGLYRNLQMGHENTVDVSEVKLHFISKDDRDNASDKDRFNNRKRNANVRHRPKKKVDEPLVWNVTDK